MKDLSLILEQSKDRICELMATANAYQSKNLDRQYTVCFDLAENKAYLIDQKKGENVERFSALSNDFLALKTYASEYNSREEQYKGLCDYMQAKIDAETPKEAIGRILGRLSFNDRSAFQNTNNEHPEWGDSERLEFLERSFPPIEYTPSDILSQQELTYKTYELLDEFSALVDAAKDIKVCDENDKRRVGEALNQINDGLKIHVELGESFFNTDNLTALAARFDKGDTGSASFEAFVEFHAKQALDEQTIKYEDAYMATVMPTVLNKADDEIKRMCDCLRDVEGYAPHDFFQLAKGTVETMNEISFIKTVQENVQTYLETGEVPADKKAVRNETITRD